MKLVYDKTGEEVKVGDPVDISGRAASVTYFREPHNPASSGKVTIKYGDGDSMEYYVGVIGATWIEREDR